MKDQVKILLVGAGGYGATYLYPLLDGDDSKYHLEGIVEPYPNGVGRIDEIRARNIPIYNTMAEFYAEHEADLAAIATPIHLHTPMILEALSHGSNVVCEKPLCGDDRDIDRLIEARDKAGKFVFIGYQWSHSDAILGLKRDIMDGVFGRPELLKTLMLWPRDHSYYGRGTGWAGHMYAKDGSLIRDSVANNATAHYLHNMFFVLGKTIDTSLMPVSIESKAYHANNIDSFDTAEICCTFEDGVKAYYFGTHACDTSRPPILEYRFEKGTVHFDDLGSGIVIYADMKDGTRKVYGDPNYDCAHKLFIAADNILYDRDVLYCGIEAASVQTRVIAAVHAQHPTIEAFPADMIEDIEINGKTFTICKGLSQRFIEAYEAL